MAFYDADSIRVTSQGYVAVWDKKKASPNTILKSKVLDYVIGLVEADCSLRKLHYIQATFFFEVGDSDSLGASPWRFVIPDSVNDTLLIKVCRAAGK
jgi:hypothetical protein